MKKRLLMILLVVALLVTAAVFAVQADPTVTNACPCSANCEYKLDGTGTQWTTFAADTVPVNGGHYLVSKNVTRTAALDINTGATFVIRFENNAELSCAAADRTLVLRAGTTAHLVGNGKLTGWGVNNYGGLVRTMTNAKLYIHNNVEIYKTAGTTTTTQTDGGLICAQTGSQVIMDGGKLTATNCTNGGAVAVQGAYTGYELPSFTMTGGEIDATAVTVTKGGAIYSSGGPITVSGGTVKGGVATDRGGAIHGQSTCVLTVSGTADIVGTPKTGTNSKRGGTISFDGATFNMTGGTLRDGYAQYGGNVFQGYGTINITGGTIKNGQASDFGGNIYLYDGSTEISDTSGATLIQNGTATSGGNIYIAIYSPTSGTYDGGNCTINLTNTNSKILNGTATDGGSIYSAYALTITKANISGGSATSGGAIYVKTGNTYIKGGSVSGASATNGGAVYVDNGTLHLDGGAITGCTVTENGGAIYSKKTVNINGVTVNGGTATYGGAIYMESGALNVVNGTITGGTATNGGAIYVEAGTFTMEGGIVTGGNATGNGGNINLAGGTNHSITGGQINNGVAKNFGGIQLNVACDISNVSFTGNRATAYGGTLAFASGKAHTMTSCTIDGTTTATTYPTHGGAIYVASGSTVTMSGGSISNCKATGLGGAVYNLGTFNMINGASISNCSDGGSALQGGAVYAGGSFTMTGSSITGCSAKQGGAIYVASGKTVTMTDGSISDCSATNRGGAVYVNGGTFNMEGEASLTVKSDQTNAHSPGVYAIHGTVNMSGDAQVTGLGSTAGRDAYAVYIITWNDSAAATATLNLSGKAKVTADENTKNIMIFSHTPENNVSKLNVAAGWSGEASVNFEGCGEIDGSFGQLLDSTYATVGGAYNGDLRLENDNDLRPGIFYDEDEKVLLVSSVYVKDVTEEGVQWYANNAAAVDAAGNDANSVIYLFSNADLDLKGKTVFVNFNGQKDVNVSNGTLCGIDTATAITSNTAVASANIDNTVTVKTLVANPLSNISYVAMDGHFYPIRVNQTGMTMNPTNTGLYFNAKVEWHSALNIEAYGIKVKVDVEGKEYHELDVQGEPVNGEFYGYVNGIMGAGIVVDGEPVSDDTAGKTPILASLYVKLDVKDDKGNNLKVYSDEYSKTFKEALETVDGKWGILSQTLKDTILDMYEDYEETLSNWNLQNIIEDYDLRKESQEG